jgi:transglutaminase-like putative cysteine protease
MTRLSNFDGLPLETRRLAWTAAIVLGASVPHWLALPPWVTVLLVAAVVWRFVVGLYGWRLPPRALRVALASAAFLGVLLDYRTLNGIEAGSALLVVMLALKFLESQGQRDQLVTIMISYFLIFASLLTDHGPVTVAYVGLLAWLTTVALLQIGRRGELMPYRTTARLGARLLLHALPIMAVLFVLFPRLPGPLWGIPGSTSSGASGLNDTMSPGDITNLGLSDEIAFRVEFESTVPRASELYWRGPSLTNFNGRTWSMSQGTRRGERVVDTLAFTGIPTTYRVMLEQNGRPWAFALDMPQSWSGDAALRMGSDYQLGTFFGGARPRRLDYRVTSYVQYAAREPLTPIEREMFTALPADSSPRTRALVSAWLEERPTGAEIVDRALGYLRSQPFAYTLSPPALGAEPVDEFLFDTREGFCEHFASALTVLMRAAGVPARVVMGYQGGEFNGAGGYYIIRQSDAHAWTEVWLEDRGWVRVDGVATVAPERVALGFDRARQGAAATSVTALPRSWLRRASLVWDAIDTRWQAWVIGYGADFQRTLLGRLGLEQLRRAQRSAVLLALSIAASAVVLIGLSFYLGWSHRRGTPRDRAAECFARFTRHLKRHDVAAPAPTEGPAAFAARAARALPHAAGTIQSIVQLYLRARYEPDDEGAALAELERSVDAFRAARA